MLKSDNVFLLFYCLARVSKHGERDREREREGEGEREIYLFILWDRAL